MRVDVERDYLHHRYQIMVAILDDELVAMDPTAYDLVRRSILATERLAARDMVAILQIAAEWLQRHPEAEYSYGQADPLAGQMAQAASREGARMSETPDPIQRIYAADAELNRRADEANAKIRELNKALADCHMVYGLGRDDLSWNETTNNTWQLHWMGRPLLEWDRMNRIHAAQRIDTFLADFAKYAEEQASRNEGSAS
jgi:hypothetical protein